MKVCASTEYLRRVINGAKRFTKQHREDYCSTYYSNKNYQDTYAISFEQFPCKSTLNIPSHVIEETMLPPIARKQPGRPSNNDRKKRFNEGKFKRCKVTHNKCGTSGYNKKIFPTFAAQN
ncbi:hypothetical protein H5410_035729 [Solanum commersonii]|uniref:Uncharacterized protein n=1 Tax=Solanum commersonii TaxID=4109 RepID=A0A9J5Y242_SOLCO|nr:hypothetical protein H5410_035729 [Solanum commersonii]